MGSKRVGMARVKALINENNNQLNVRHAGTKVVTADTTLSKEDSGKVILMAANGIDITLPSAAAGMSFSIILTGDYDTAVCTVVQAAASEDFYGHVFFSESESAATDGDSGGSGDTKITFGTASKRGDRVELVSDGSVWYARAYAKNYAGIVFN